MGGMQVGDQPHSFVVVFACTSVRHTEAFLNSAGLVRVSCLG